VKVLRAEERYRTVQPGIVTRHCFSAGAHYDPDNLSFGPLIGLDDHLLEPGAGFAEHAHRGVRIFSWIAEGRLEHSVGDEVLVINAEESLVQEARDGFRHSERNASSDQSLRLIQTTVLAEEGVTFDVLRSAAEVAGAWVHLFVVDGSWSLDELSLEPGDSARLTDGASHAVAGSGTLLVVRGSVASPT
jgi:hypothetical protein